MRNYLLKNELWQKKWKSYFLLFFVLIGSYGFTNAQCGQNAPYLESFTGLTSNTVPTCWVTSATTGGPWRYTTSNPDFGSNVDFPDHTNGTTNNEYVWVDMSGTDVGVILESPSVNITSLTSPMLEYYFVSHNNSGSVSTFNLLYAEAWNGSTWQTVNVTQGEFGAQWNEVRIDLSNYTYSSGDSVKVRFRAESGGDGFDYDNDMLLDDVSVKELTGCLDPSNATTVNVASTTATGIWSSNGPGLSYELEIGASGFVPGTGTLVPTTDTFVNATGLTPNTGYDWYVRKICGPSIGDTSNWVGPISFTTTLAPLSNPTACGLALGMPDNSSISIPLTVSGAVGTQLGVDVIVTDVNIVLNHTFRGDVDLFLRSPNGVLVELFTDIGSSGDDFGINNGICDSAFNLNMFAASGATSFGTSSAANGSYIPEGDFATFNDNSNPNGLWTLEYTDDAGGDVGSLEYFEIVLAAPPTCNIPLNLNTINIGATTATGVWSSQGGPATSFQLEIGPAGFAQGTGTLLPATDTFLNATSLTPNTSYDWYVREICGAGDSSIWAGPESFATLCVPFAAPFNENFDGLALVSPYTALPGCWDPQVGPDFWDVTNDITNNGSTYLPNIGDHTTGTANYMWIDASSDITVNEMVTPQIDLSGLAIPYAGFWFASNNTANATNHTIALDVWDGSAWVQVVTERGNFNGWVEVSDELPPGIPSITQFRIYAIPDTGTTASTYFQNDLGVDDFFVIEKPACIAPTSPITGNITATSATASWLANIPTSTWEVEYGLNGFAPGTGVGTSIIVVDTFANITGLTQGIVYDWYVREICAPGDTSIWVGPATFKTPCGVVVAGSVLPFIEGWENINGTQQGISNIVCDPTYRWDLTTSDPTGRARFGTDAVSVSTGSGAITLDVNPSGPVNINYLDLTLDLTAYTTAGLELYFDFSHHGEESSPNDRVWLRGSDTSAWIEVYDIYANRPGTGTWTSVGPIDIDAAIATNGQTITNSFQVRFGQEDNFPATTPTASDGFSFDNIRVDLEPTCPQPTAFVVNSTTTTTADISWTSNASGSAWEIQYDTAGFVPGTGLFASSTDTFTTLTGLVQSTAYDAYVREICSPGDTSSWFLGSFTTAIGNPSNCGLNQVLPDGNGPAFLDIPIEVSGAGAVNIAAVNLILDHTYVSDVVMELVSPNGDTVLLFDSHGGTGDHFGLNNGACDTFLTFTDTASAPISSGTTPFIGNYSPDEPLAGLTGGNGVWILRYQDNFNADQGTLQYIELVFEVANDAPCGAAELIVGAAPASFTNEGSGFDVGEPIGSCWTDGAGGTVGLLDNTVWFYFVAPANGAYFVSTNYPGTPNDDTQIAAYLASNGCGDYAGYTEIGCGEDIDAVNYLSEMTTSAVGAGDTVYVQVDGWAATIGSFDITVSQVAPPMAGFTFSGTNQTISFTDTSSGNPTSWAWDFGDGNTATTQNPTNTYAASGTYTVCLVASNGSGSDSTCQSVMVISGLNNSLAQFANVYPNPAKDRMVIEVTSKSLKGYEIVDMMGRTIITSTENIIGTKEINVSTLTPGNYIMKLNFGDEVGLHKFMIQR